MTTIVLKGLFILTIAALKWSSTSRSIEVAKAAALLQRGPSLIPWRATRLLAALAVWASVAIRILDRPEFRLLHHIRLREVIIISVIIRLTIFLWSWRRILHVEILRTFPFLDERVSRGLKIIIAWKLLVHHWFCLEVIMEATISSLEVLLVLLMESLRSSIIYLVATCVHGARLGWWEWLELMLERPVCVWLLVICIFIGLALVGIAFIILTKFLLRRLIFHVAASVSLLLIAASLEVPLVVWSIWIPLLWMLVSCRASMVLLSSMLMKLRALLRKAATALLEHLLILDTLILIVNLMAFRPTPLVVVLVGSHSTATPVKAGMTLVRLLLMCLRRVRLLVSLVCLPMIRLRMLSVIRLIPTSSSFSGVGRVIVGRVVKLLLLLLLRAGRFVTSHWILLIILY